MKILTLHTPVAVDPRRISTIMKSNADLERFADRTTSSAEDVTYISWKVKSPATDGGIPWHTSRLCNATIQCGNTACMRSTRRSRTTSLLIFLEAVKMRVRANNQRLACNRRRCQDSPRKLVDCQPLKFGTGKHDRRFPLFTKTINLAIRIDW